MEQFLVPAGEGASEYMEKKSRFLGLIVPVTTEAEARARLEAVKKQEYDARHNCWAYILHSGQKRYSDDGEPQGTAGMPALNVLQKEELTDCVLVVTRYFGGILLGGGGLVRAYSHAAKIAVDAGGIVTRAECSIVKIRCDYTFYGRLASLIPEQGGIVEDTAFEDVVTVKMRIPQELEPAFEARLVDLSNGTCRGEITDTVFADID
mgnify:CR=1 FL=1